MHVSNVQRALEQVKPLWEECKLDEAEMIIKKILKNKKTSLISIEFALVFYLSTHRGLDQLKGLLRQVYKIERPTCVLLRNLCYYYEARRDWKQLNFFIKKGLELYSNTVFFNIFNFKSLIGEGKSQLASNYMEGFLDKFNTSLSQDNWETFFNEFIQDKKFMSVIEKVDDKYNLYDKLGVDWRIQYIQDILMFKQLYTQAEEKLEVFLKDLASFEGFIQLDILQTYANCIAKGKGHILPALSFMDKAIVVYKNTKCKHKLAGLYSSLVSNKICLLNYVDTCFQAEILSLKREGWLCNDLVMQLKNKLDFFLCNINNLLITTNYYY